jgi:hypothetical protein
MTKLICKVPSPIVYPETLSVPVGCWRKKWLVMFSEPVNNFTNVLKLADIPPVGTKFGIFSVTNVGAQTSYRNDGKVWYVSYDVGSYAESIVVHPNWF